MAFTERKNFITLHSVDSFLLDRDPEFVDYLFFHNVLDKFCWMLKLHYADRQTVKQKRYRIDTLFQRYIYLNQVNVSKARKCLAKEGCAQKIEFYLTKGWHNELVRSDPLHPDYLHIGTKLSSCAAPGSGGMVAWNIVQSYYAFYELWSCIAYAIKPHLQIEGHRIVSREFNNHILGKGRNRLLFYPFTLSSATPAGYIPEHPKHCQYSYATYPRDTGHDIEKLEHEVQKAFELIGRDKKSSLIDTLYEFRKWANYTGVQSLLKLTDGAYQGFLMKNLATIVFFAGGMAELAALFSLGEAKYFDMLKRFSKDYIDKNERFARNKYLIPSYIRLRAYKHLGIVSEAIDFIIQEPVDPLQFIDV